MTYSRWWPRLLTRSISREYDTARTLSLSLLRESVHSPCRDGRKQKVRATALLRSAAAEVYAISATRPRSPPSPPIPACEFRKLNNDVKKLIRGTRVCTFAVVVITIVIRSPAPRNPSCVNATYYRRARADKSRQRFTPPSPARSLRSLLPPRRVLAA